MSHRTNYQDEGRGSSSTSDYYAQSNLPSYQEQQQSGNHFAGVGAGKNAYRPASPSTIATEYNTNSNPETPSMYTDPFESRSTAPPPNINSTRPISNFLQSDPYSNNNQQLSRSDTIGPHDSVSSYNVPYLANNLAAGGDPGRDQPKRGYAPSQINNSTTYHHQDYNPSGLNTHHVPGYSYDYDQDPDDTMGAGEGNPNHLYDPSSNSLPLKYNAGQMGYAENEEDEAYQMNDKSRGAYGGGHYRDDSRSTVQGVGPAGLFSNQTGPPPDGVYNNKDPDSEAKTGLLGKIKGGSLEEQIEKRRKGIGRQRWPILSWLLG